MKHRPNTSQKDISAPRWQKLQKTFYYSSRHLEKIVDGARQYPAPPRLHQKSDVLSSF